ncbi:MAG: hypothetical protein ACK2U1_13555, partial [Anaerolineales bacterium]
KITSKRGNLAISQKAHNISCNDKIVNVHRAPHLPRYRALEVQLYVCVPGALHLRHPVNAYRAVR